MTWNYIKTWIVWLAIAIALVVALNWIGSAIFRTEGPEEATEVAEAEEPAAAPEAAAPAEEEAMAEETSGDAVAEAEEESAEASADEADETAGAEEAQAEEPAAPEEADAAEEAAPIAIAGDAAEGQKVFRRCQACHNVTAGGAHKVGPNLYGVAGAPVARHADFRYSSAMAEHGGTWTPELLDAFLTSPAESMPGTRMTFAGLADEQDRANVIAYLQSLSE